MPSLLSLSQIRLIIAMMAEYIREKDGCMFDENLNCNHCLMFTQAILVRLCNSKYELSEAHFQISANIQYCCNILKIIIVDNLAFLCPLNCWWARNCPISHLLLFPSRKEYSLQPREQTVSLSNTGGSLIFWDVQYHTDNRKCVLSADNEIDANILNCWYKAKLL